MASNSTASHPPERACRPPEAQGTTQNRHGGRGFASARVELPGCKLSLGTTGGTAQGVTVGEIFKGIAEFLRLNSRTAFALFAAGVSLWALVRFGIVTRDLAELGIAY